MQTRGVPNGEVYVGVRPEGLVPCENGSLSCSLTGMEVMGRDVSILSAHPAAQAPTVRAIVSSDTKLDIAAQQVRFSLKPSKTFLFDKATEQSIPLVKKAHGMFRFAVEKQLANEKGGNV